MEDRKDFFSWIEKYIHALPRTRRRKLVDEITESSSPKFDYFLMVILSSAVATLGLINDSPAVIIGAMVVAPLMSPIIGIGMASITGNSKLAKNAFTAIIAKATIKLLSRKVSLKRKMPAAEARAIAYASGHNRHSGIRRRTAGEVPETYQGITQSDRLN